MTRMVNPGKCVCMFVSKHISKSISMSIYLKRNTGNEVFKKSNKNTTESCNSILGETAAAEENTQFRVGLQKGLGK